MSGTNGLDHINRNEFEQAAAEMVANIVELQEAFNAVRGALNTQGEVCGLHRYILEKFVPKPQLEAAAREYYEIRQREIQSLTVQPANA